MSIDRWMDKEDVVHIYNGILLSHIKEQNNAICSNMDATRDYHTKWRTSERERQIPYDKCLFLCDLFHLESSYLNPLIVLLLALLRWFHGWVIFHCTWGPQLLYPFFCFLGYLRCNEVGVLVHRAALNFGVPVSCWFLVFPIYTPMSGSALCSPSCVF